MSYKLLIGKRRLTTRINTQKKWWLSNSWHLPTDTRCFSGSVVAEGISQGSAKGDTGEILPSGVSDGNSLTLGLDQAQMLLCSISALRHLPSLSGWNRLPSPALVHSLLRHSQYLLHVLSPCSRVQCHPVGTSLPLCLLLFSVTPLPTIHSERERWPVPLILTGSHGLLRGVGAKDHPAHLTAGRRKS